MNASDENRVSLRGAFIMYAGYWFPSAIALSLTGLAVGMIGTSTQIARQTSTPADSWLWAMLALATPLLMSLVLVSSRRIWNASRGSDRVQSTRLRKPAFEGASPGRPGHLSRTAKLTDISGALDTEESNFRNAPMVRLVAITLIGLACLCIVTLLPFPFRWQGMLGPWWLVLVIALGAIGIVAVWIWPLQDEMDFTRSAILSPPLYVNDSAEGMDAFRQGLQLSSALLDKVTRYQMGGITFAAATVGMLGSWPVRLLWVALICWTFVGILLTDPWSRAALRWARIHINSASEVPYDTFVLYLRGFDEDSLSLPFEATRAFLYQILSLVNHIRFEELIAACFTEQVSLVAVSPPGSNAVPMGATRVRFENETWQTQVHELLKNADGVLMSATPPSVNDGLSWELRTLSRLDADRRRIGIVLGPWPEAERIRRFRTFCSEIEGDPFFRGIEEFDANTTLMIYHNGWRWQAICADRCDDSAYAMAIQEWSSLRRTSKRRLLRVETDTP